MNALWSIHFLMGQHNELLTVIVLSTGYQAADIGSAAKIGRTCRVVLTSNSSHPADPMWLLGIWLDFPNWTKLVSGKYGSRPPSVDVRQCLYLVPRRWKGVWPVAGCSGTQ